MFCLRLTIAERYSCHLSFSFLLFSWSGSTFTGDVLSASAKASYIYEPLFSLNRTNVRAWDDGRNKELARQAEWLVSELFNCGRVRKTTVRFPKIESKNRMSKNIK